jgi:hypothetical protein
MKAVADPKPTRRQRESKAAHQVIEEKKNAIIRTNAIGTRGTTDNVTNRAGFDIGQTNAIGSHK